MNIEVTDEKVAEVMAMTSKDSMLEHVAKFDDHWLSEQMVKNGTCNHAMEPAAKVTSGHKVNWCDECSVVMQNMWTETFCDCEMNSYGDLVSSLEAGGHI